MPTVDPTRINCRLPPLEQSRQGTVPASVCDFANRLDTSCLLPSLSLFPISRFLCFWFPEEREGDHGRGEWRFRDGAGFGSEPGEERFWRKGFEDRWLSRYAHCGGLASPSSCSLRVADFVTLFVYGFFFSSISKNSNFRQFRISEAKVLYLIVDLIRRNFVSDSFLNLPTGDKLWGGLQLELTGWIAWSIVTSRAISLKMTTPRMMDSADVRSLRKIRG